MKLVRHRGEGEALSSALITYSSHSGTAIISICLPLYFLALVICMISQSKCPWYKPRFSAFFDVFDECST